MMHRIFTVIVVVPIAILLIAVSVANRAPTIFTLDPFNPGNPALSVQVPLFVLLLLTLVLGLIAGSALTWFKQHKYRKAAREKELTNERAARRDTALTTRSA
ncbi:MAG: lipopolysaccharide assembly protein LapA domain-containing protein [Mesorhizobium sp.]|nr:lipopolysaccharide assembly protein LapA domain-containing protein [Mesorhizobium sp.]